MEQARFEEMVARLEGESRRAPGAYQAKVAALVLLGFAVLALIVGTAGAGLLLLAAVPFALWFFGVHALGLLVGLGKLLLLLAVPLWFLVKSSLSALMVRLPAPQGEEIRRRQAPALFVAIDGMRRRMNGPRFHHVLITDELNAAVVQRPLFGLFGWPRNYLILGLPLLDSLSPEEALAVVAHEYGHLAGSHGRFAAFVYRLRNTWGTIQAISEHWNGWSAGMLRRVIGWYAPYFNAYTFVLARGNEYEADAAAAELVGAGVAADALKRVNLGIAHHGRFMEQTFGRMREEPVPPADLSVQWAGIAAHVPAEHAPQWLQRALDRAGRVDDTHPVLRDRLRALQGEKAVLALPTPLHGSTAAQAWLAGHLPLLRSALQSRWHESVSQPWKERHDEFRKLRQRLDELLALQQPDTEQQVERLRLQLDLRPQDDHAEALARFNAEHPGHALGLFLEGRWRLDQGDAAGLETLERAMSLDASATKAACERAHAWLSERNDARAEAYAERWRKRHAWEQEGEKQMQRLDVTHELRAPDLPREHLATATGWVQAHTAEVAEAYLARRVLPADPELPTYVLAIEMTASPQPPESQQALVERLANAGDWPMHVIICTLDGENRSLKPRLQALRDARIV